MNANEIYKTLDKLTKRITIIKDMLPLADSIIVFHCYADIEKIKSQVDKINKEIENARRLGVWGTDY
jgi:tetrahydromethanopterin S-methyltransferase subunit G